jgi:uncharacterized protein with ATP-grasp and redox domains
MLCKDEERVASVLTRVLAEASRFDVSRTPPELGQIIHRTIREELSEPDPYRALKRRSTERALSIAGDIAGRISASPSPFEAALRYAIAGNIMDFGMRSTWDEDHIAHAFSRAESAVIDITGVKKLYHELSIAKTVLVLGDNAGEAVFDRVMIEQFPGSAKVYYAVKGGPVINDVILEDALESGLDSVAEIISNGADAQGTLLDQCTPEFNELFERADVVIAKGQGNFETLNNAPRDIWFLLQVKCAVIAHHYNYHVGDWLITTLSSFRAREVAS